jgi:glycosyltransferase involved in cell wall biosynthesis
VSVLMGVYNGERYVRDAIDSILGQTFPDFEFLVINDGSTDATRSIVSAYRDPRIRLIDNETNIGLTRTLNRGMQLAKGAFVARQDADDVSEPERLGRQVAFMERHPELALLGSWYREISADGRVQRRLRLPTEQAELQWALLFYCPFVHSGVMLRKAHFLEEIGCYDEKFQYAQDHELWFRTSRQKPLRNLPEYLVRYRMNPHSMTETYGELTNEGAWLCAAAVAELLGWAADDLAANQVRFSKLFGMLYGDAAALDPAELEPLTSEIWALHQAFCTTYRLDEPTAARHRDWLRAWMSQRFVRVARDYARQGRGSEAWRIYLDALRGWPRASLSVNAARTASELLLAEPVRSLGRLFSAGERR